MSVIVVADIFGRTPALEKLCSELPVAVEIVDPYEQFFMAFKQESEAYQCFMSQVGLDKYTEILIEKCLSTRQVKTLVGFSIGASAIWRLSETLAADNVSSAFCFYGSQIRHFSTINPCFNIEVFLPRIEQSFSVNEMGLMLSEKKTVTINNTPYLHGFMNRCSQNYNQEGYQKYHKMLSKSIIKPGVDF